ncbi:MAG: Bax inhibitor-1 family protein [Candidatus Ozemobacteraceae bacterium]
MSYQNRVPNPTQQNDVYTEIRSGNVQWTGMSQATFLSRVLPYFGGGLLITALGTRFGMGLGNGLLLPALIANIGLYFALLWQRHTPGLNVALYYAYTFVNGLLLGPLVGLAHSISPYIVIQALGLTSLGFFTIAGYVYTTGKDMSGMGPYLISGLVVIIFAGILNFFVGGAGLGFGISVISVFLFMGFTAYDMSNIMLKFRDEEYILAVVELYLDFINLFVAILRILISISGGRSRD